MNGFCARAIISEEARFELSVALFRHGLKLSYIGVMDARKASTPGTTNRNAHSPFSLLPGTSLSFVKFVSNPNKVAMVSIGTKGALGEPCGRILLRHWKRQGRSDRGDFAFPGKWEL